MRKSPFTDLSAIREVLDKSQSELAELLGVSTRAVQSYEQGWRPVPVHVQKAAGLLLFLNWRKQGLRPVACWKTRQCSPEKRASCPTYEFRAGDLCWLINGTRCGGKPKKSWKAKLATCVACPAMGQWLRA